MGVGQNFRFNLDIRFPVNLGLANQSSSITYIIKEKVYFMSISCPKKYYNKIITKLNTGLNRYKPVQQPICNAYNVQAIQMHVGESTHLRGLIRARMGRRVPHPRLPLILSHSSSSTVDDQPPYALTPVLTPYNMGHIICAICYIYDIFEMILNRVSFAY